MISLICFYNEEGGFGKLFDGPWVADATVQEVVGCYTNWEPDLVHLVEMIQEPSRWAVHVVDPLPFYVSRHVALLGDAAHAMTTHQGIGGGQAIEDAHILGRLLAHEKTTLLNLTQILSIYEKIRLPLAQAAAERSWSNGLLYDFIHPNFEVKPNSTAEELKPLGDAVGAAFAWLGQGGCEDDWRDAKDYLAQMG